MKFITLSIPVVLVLHGIGGAFADTHAKKTIESCADIDILSIAEEFDHFTGKETSKNEYSYTGSCLNGKANGDGIAKYSGISFKGNFVNG